MAKLWVKFQRSFRRRPVRFFTLLALYLAAGSLVFLHAGFTGEPRVAGSQRSPGAGEGLGLPYLGATRLSRGFSEVTVGRRRGHWFKGMAKEPAERSRAGDYGAARSRAPKGRGGRDKEEDRGKGCSGVPLGWPCAEIQGTLVLRHVGEMFLSTWHQYMCVC